MALIKTTDELKDYIAVDINFQQRNLAPYLDQGKSEVVRLLGKTLYNALDEYHNDPSSNERPLFDALIPYAQRCLANFALHKGLSALNVTIGPTGIGVVNTDHIAPASKDRTDALKADLLNAAHDAMEDMLEFLEENIDDYPAWESSQAYALQYDTIIPSARIFDELLRIDRSRLTFLEYKPTMSDMETLVLSTHVSNEYLDELKAEIKTQSVSTENNKVLQMLQKALAYLTKSKHTKDKQDEYERIGTQYLMNAKRYMDANITDYPVYAASSAYIAPNTYKRHENTEDSSFFIFGG